MTEQISKVALLVVFAVAIGYFEGVLVVHLKTLSQQLLQATSVTLFFPWDSLHLSKRTSSKTRAKINRKE